MVGAAVGRLPGGDLGDRRLRTARPPRVQVGPGPDDAALDPPVAGAPARRGDAEVQMAGAGVAGTPELADRLPGGHVYPGRDGRLDRRQVRAVVTHAVVAEDRHRQA